MSVARSPVVPGFFDACFGDPGGRQPAVGDLVDACIEAVPGDLMGYWYTYPGSTANIVGIYLGAWAIPGKHRFGWIDVDAWTGPIVYFDRPFVAIAGPDRLYCCHTGRIKTFRVLSSAGCDGPPQVVQ